MCVLCSQPDVMAPGVLILAALPPPKTAKPSTPEFGLRSGTSMSCPHVSGAAAFVKAHRPSWTPSMIKSALMTTGIASSSFAFMYGLLIFKNYFFYKKILNMYCKI